MTPRWTSTCTGCARVGVEVEPRPDHHERVLCDGCAGRPFRVSAAPDESSYNGAGPKPLAPSAAQAQREVVLTPATAIRAERLHWLWDRRMPRRSLVVVAGEKGLGKSLLTNAQLPALITRGALEGELHGTPADVLIVTAEDGWGAVVKPRLMAAGADLDRVHRVEVKSSDGDSLFTLPDDVARLERQIATLRERGRTVAMVCVDPIGAFLSGSLDTHRDASVRRALAPLASMSERLDIVTNVVAHLTKDESGRLINRVSGAGAFVNAARSVLVLARDPGDSAGEQGTERVLMHVASNWGTYAPTLAWRVESREVEVDDGSVASVGHLAPKGETSLSVDDLQRGPDETGQDAEEAIAAALANGPRPSREVKSKVKAELGCGQRTVERAAGRMSERRELLIEQGGFPRTTTWALASDATPASPVAPSPEPPDGVTGSHAVVTGDSALSRATDGSPARGGATGADEDSALADRAERLAGEYPDLADGSGGGGS